MITRHFSKLLIIILGLAAVVRLSVLVLQVNLPVMWDARRYVGAALAIISYVDSSGPEVSPDPEADRLAFDYYYQKYIQGEQIDWLYYKPLRLQQARDDIFFSGPLYPSVMAALIVISPAADFTVIRLLGILGDLLALYLLVLIAVRLVGRRAGLIAGLMYAFYFPFMLTSTSLLLEPSTSLLLLATIFMTIRSVETDRKGLLAWSGLLLGLLVLNKPTAMLLGAPVLAGLYFYSRDRWPTPKFVRRALLLVLPLAVCFASWLTLTSIRYGQLTLRDPSYAGANIRQSSSVKFEGYDLDRVEPEFWEREPYGDLLERPLDYVGLFAKKFERLYSRPYNDFERTLILPLSAQEGMHVIIVGLGLVGLLWLVRWRFASGIWPLAIVLYYTGIHLIYHSINRYSYNALPLIMMCASGLIIVLWDRLASGAGARRRTILALLCIAVAWVLSPIALDWLHFPVTPVLSWLVLILELGLLGWAGYLVMSEDDKVRPAGTSLTLSGLGVLVFAAVLWSQQVSREAWAEFDCKIDSPDMKVGTVIFQDQMEPLEPGERLYLALDVDIPDTATSGFVIEINGTSHVMPAAIRMDEFFYPKAQVYRAYAGLLDTRLRSFRQYRLLELSPEAVKASFAGLGYLDVSLYQPPDSRAGAAFIVHGVRAVDDGKAYIPSPDGLHASVERWVHRRDARIRIPVDFASDSTISYYIERNRYEYEPKMDLSKAIGKQTGRYNIYLLRTDHQDGMTVY